MTNITVPPFKIRRASVEDAPALKICVDAAYRHYIERIGEPPGPMLDDYAEIVQTHTVYVVDGAVQADLSETIAPTKIQFAIIPPAIIGVLVLVETSSYFLLDNIAVHPTSQGQGIGRQLMAWAEVVAKERGQGEIHLYTHELMTENIDIYSKIGYVETERRTERGFPRVYMKKQL